MSVWERLPPIVRTSHAVIATARACPYFLTTRGTHGMVGDHVCRRGASKRSLDSGIKCQCLGQELGTPDPFQDILSDVASTPRTNGSARIRPAHVAVAARLLRHDAVTQSVGNGADDATNTRCAGDRRAEYRHFRRHGDQGAWQTLPRSCRKKLPRGVSSAPIAAVRSAAFGVGKGCSVQSRADSNAQPRQSGPGSGRQRAIAHDQRGALGRIAPPHDAGEASAVITPPLAASDARGRQTKTSQYGE